MIEPQAYKVTDIGTLPSAWEVKTLTELLSFIVDNRGKTVPTSEVGVPLIATNCIKEIALYPLKDKLRFISQEVYEKWFRSHPLPNDIIFVNKGTPGQVCLVPDPVDFCIAQDMVALRANSHKIEWKFLFAYLRSNALKKQVAGLNVGTTIPHLKKSLFHQLLIPIPSKKEQTIIGDMYYSLSSKIELNIQMNQTLETMAQAIFDEWFVNFNFPGFNDEMIDDIPKGWKKGKLGNALELKYGKALKAEIRTHGNYPVVGSNGIVGYNNEYLVEAPGIVIGRKGTIGKVIWVNENFFPIDTTFYIKDLIGVQDLYYHYFLLKQQVFKTIASDSAVPGLNRNQAMTNLTVIPNLEVVNEFNSIVKPFFKKKELLENEIKYLTQLRDSLLPKLMTGKIEVNV